MTAEREVAGPAGIEPDRPPRVRRGYQVVAALCLVAAVQATILAGLGVVDRRLAFGSAVVLVAGAVTLIVKSVRAG